MMEKHICTISFTYQNQFIHQRLTSEHLDMSIDEALSYCCENFDRLGVQLDKTGEVQVFNPDGSLRYLSQNLLGLALLSERKGVRK